jgi:hypothetical protein
VERRWAHSIRIGNSVWIVFPFLRVSILTFSQFGLQLQIKDIIENAKQNGFGMKIYPFVLFKFFNCILFPNGSFFSLAGNLNVFGDCSMYDQSESRMSELGQALLDGADYVLARSTQSEKKAFAFVIPALQDGSFMKVSVTFEIRKKTSM